MSTLTKAMPRKSTRNYALDAIKVLFAVSVALGHFQIGFLSSNTVVECFFILSGFFLVQSFHGGRYEDAYHYSKMRIKRIYPYYITAFMILFLYLNRNALTDIVNLFDRLISSLPELLFLQNIGIFNGGINYPLWQLCVLIVVSHIWFACLSWNHQMTINVVCPIVAVTTLTFLANTYDTHTVDIFTVESKVFYVPLIRAAGFVAIGMMLWKPINGVQEYLQHVKGNHMIITLLSLGSIWAFWKHQWDYVAHIAFVFIMICSLSCYGLLSFALNRRVFRIGEKFSLSVYLNHALIIYIINNHFADWKNDAARLELILVFLGVLFLYSGLFILIIDGIKKLRCILRNGNTSKKEE